jgi:hypothetical protein
VCYRPLKKCRGGQAHTCPVPVGVGIGVKSGSSAFCGRVHSFQFATARPPHRRLTMVSPVPAPVPGAPIGPSAPLLARPYVPASCAPADWREAAAGATASDAAAFAPATLPYWAATFERVGKGGTAAAALAALLGLALLAAGLCSCCGTAARRRRRRREPVGAAVPDAAQVQGCQQPWPGGLVLSAGAPACSASPAHPPSCSRRARGLRWAIRCTAMATALVAFISASIGAARVSALTASAVPDFWAAVGAAQAATAVALYSAKGAVASLADTAAGLEALSQALASANASSLLAAAQKVPILGRDGKAAAAGVSTLTATVAGAATQARAAEVGGRSALARFDGSDGSGGGGGLEAVAAFRERWQARSTAAAPTVRAAVVGASLGLLALAALTGGLVAAVDPARPSLPLAVAVALCLAAAVSAAGGLAGVATARSAARDACLLAESTAAAALVTAGGGGADGDALTTIARFYLDTPPGDVEDDVLPAAPAGADAAAPQGRGQAGAGALNLAPAPVVQQRPERDGGGGGGGGGITDLLPRLPALAAPPAPNLRLGGGREAPAWVPGGGGGGGPPPPPEGASSGGPVSFIAAPPPPPPQGEGNNTRRRRRHLSADEGAASPPAAPTPAPDPPPPGLATALGLDVATLRAALADPTTVALLNTLSSGAGKALLGRTSLSPAAQAAAEALPGAVEETAARLDAFEAASGRAAFRPALVALKRLPCCTADAALRVWGGAWVMGGIGAVCTAVGVAVLGLWRGGRRVRGGVV